MQVIHSHSVWLCVLVTLRWYVALLNESLCCVFFSYSFVSSFLFTPHCQTELAPGCTHFSLWWCSFIGGLIAVNPVECHFVICCIDCLDVGVQSFTGTIMSCCFLRISFRWNWVRDFTSWRTVLQQRATSHCHKTIYSGSFTAYCFASSLCKHCIPQKHEVSFRV